MKSFSRKTRTDKFSRSAEYDVHGFWARMVRVDQRVSYSLREWESPEVSWSCGGREPKKEPDGMIAAECFAKAIKDAVRVARKWSKQTGSPV